MTLYNYRFFVVLIQSDSQLTRYSLQILPFLPFSYDQECFEREMTTKDILREKIGVCREYVKIFSEFCQLAGFRVKGIRGYTKGPNFVPGMKELYDDLYKFTTSKKAF